MYDLNDLIGPALHITLLGARGINDFGQIVANGHRLLVPDYSYTGPDEAYLLTPPSQVPEPSTWALLGAGFGAGLLALAKTR